MLAVLAPLLAILALLCMLAVLLWLVERDERTRQHEDLIRDALWVEQAMLFQFTSEQERMTRFAADLGKSGAQPATFALQAVQIRQIAREIADIMLLDSDGNLRETAPQRAPERRAALDPDIAAARPIVRSGVRGTFTSPYKRDNGNMSIAFVAPVRVGMGLGAGAVVAVFELPTMLAEHVPWWIAQRRAVHIADGVGNRLASRSHVTPAEGSDSYSVQIGAPMHNASLTVVSYQTRSNLAQNGLVGAMIVLALLAAAGLIARERHLRRRLAAEEALDNAHAFRRALESSMLVGMRARDLSGRMLYVNPAFCRMVGYEAHELIGMTPPMPYWVPEDMERTWRLHDKVLAGQAIGEGLELTFQRRDGTRFDVLIYEEPLRDAAGKQRGWIGSVLDISDRKRMADFEREQAARLQHTARLVTMGEMASLLAHDLNQPLAAIRGYQTGLLNVLGRPGIEPAVIEPALRAIGEATDRAGRIVRGVHDFVKKSEPKLEPLDLADSVSATLALLEPEIRKVHASIDVALPADLPRVRADHVLIEQVLVNLIRNALEAIGSEPIDRRHIRVKASREGDRVEVRIADSGPGVPPAMAGNLFSPFASTKQSGMGMGLTICRSIVEVHGGHIRYEPAAGGGAMFSFMLEVASEAAP
jgi:two-component system sensor histidine kinase DctS